MLIKGLQKTTLLDFPQKVACTVFTGGCNFRCPFCHNASLVTHVDTSDKIGVDEFFAFLAKRTSILDGVCITGGEPLLQKDIASFISKIREMGFSVKLDTNGAFPKILKELISEGLLDYVAMDVKNSKEKYALTCGTDVDVNDIEKSMDILRGSGLEYEFRTTVVRELHTPQDIEALTEWIYFAPHYYLQSFKDSGDILRSGLSSYSEEEMKQILAKAKLRLACAELRGI